MSDCWEKLQRACCQHLITMGTYQKVSTWPQKTRSSCASPLPLHAGNGWGAAAEPEWPSHNRRDSLPACFCGAAL